MPPAKPKKLKKKGGLGPKKQPGPRDKYGRLIHSLEPDEGTRELYEHREKYHGDIADWQPLDQTHPNGRVVFRTPIKRNVRECALDRLKSASVLGPGDAAEIRYRAGEWLRKIYLECHPGRDTLSALDARGGSSFVAGVGSWSEQKISDIFYIGRVLADLGLYGNAVEAVCCHDRDNVRVSDLRAGLDMLADNHGIRRAYEDEQRAQRQHDHRHDEQRAP